MSKSIVLVSSDGVNVTFDDRAVLIRFSEFIKTSLSADANATDIPVNITSAHLTAIKSYIEHHAKKESPAPVTPIQPGISTVENTLEDKWDATFFKNLQKDEKDDLLIEFSRRVDYFNMEQLFKKTGVVVALHIVAMSGANHEKLADTFAKLALSTRV